LTKNVPWLAHLRYAKCEQREIQSANNFAQLFYNVPKGDPLAQSLDFFVHICEPIKDALGVAWCTGSGYVFRRQAIDDIGGFPKGSLAEDVATSTNMLGKGWNTAYIHEPLQFGTVPDSYGSHLKQRTRWVSLSDSI
jgi:cellulose synthase/poly-beta-1,6-N-acetylglucosamine synthase-like glycosyltransferase